MKSFKKIHENKKTHVNYFFSWKHVLVKSGETIVKSGENMLFTRLHQISQDFTRFLFLFVGQIKYYQMNFNPNFRAFGSKSPRSNSSNMPVFKGKPCKKVAAKKKSCKKTTAKQEPLKKRQTIQELK